MTRRTVYVLQNSRADQERPSVWIESLKDQQVTYGVKASGSSLKVARERAQEAFTKLRAYVEKEGKR